jgi:hypothetical protein
MMSALGSMPVILLPDYGGSLPQGAPGGQTIKALKRRGLIERRDNAWVRTPLGESVWENR